MTLADSLIFRNASVRDILTAIGHFADINVVFDPQFRDQTVTVDLRKTSLEDALQAVTSSTRNFYKISAAKTITVIPDTPAKRREYEDEIIRTFFLSNADVKETLDLLRLVVDNRRLSPVAGVNAIAIKDTPGQDRRRRPRHPGHRQGAGRGGHRRRAARGRPRQAARVRPAARLAGVARHQRQRRRQPRQPDA